jgi:hypothetical protein
VSGGRVLVVITTARGRRNTGNQEETMKKRQKEILAWTGLGLLAFVWLMSSRRDCGQNCQAMLQPIAKDGVRDIVTALFT